MNILVIGAGGREHTLVWKFSQEKNVQKIFCAPGNAGTAELAQNIDINPNDFSALIKFAKENEVGLTVVGPEEPLAKGIVDEFENAGLKCFGPKKNAAIIEASKGFARNLMHDNQIPGPKFAEFSSVEAASKYIKEQETGVVVKADGLAAGKGVTIAENETTAIDAVKECLVDNRFGDSGKKVLIEELLEGEEASFMVFSDGKTVIPMVSSQDHKKVFEGDKGPNTGGMGAYSPAPVLTSELKEKAMNEVMIPTIKAMEKDGRKFKGILYAGLMIKDKQIKVLEFNCRFGDPETQVILPRLESNLSEIMLACVDETLDAQEVKWKQDVATCVVLTSGGYPSKYDKGLQITGIDEANKLENVIVFHAGTKKQDSNILTNGGRVLGVTALGSGIKESIDLAYSAVKKINFDKMHYRKDIGKKALNR